MVSGSWALVQWGLLVLGVLGGVDEAVFHLWRDRLVDRRESFWEVVVHTVRLPVFIVLYFWAGSGFQSLNTTLIWVLVAIDGVVGVTDILIEPKSRQSLGGLSGIEYLLHMMLSMHLGILYCGLFPILLKSGEVTQVPASSELMLGQPEWFGHLFDFYGVGACGLLIFNLTKLALNAARARKIRAL